jgi:hypothetical protein
MADVVQNAGPTLDDVLKAVTEHITLAWNAAATHTPTPSTMGGNVGSLSPH